MSTKGGCYCGEVRYEFEGDAAFKMQCHCRECQYITGGGPNYIMGVPGASFKFTKNEPKEFARTDIENPSTRMFCPTCGTAIGTKSKAAPGILIIKVGTLDDPSVFEAQAAIQVADKQPFHHIPDGLPTFDRWPG